VLRLVLDEAHQILSDFEFRPQFLKLRELAEFRVQLIYLTASLPIRLESRFLTQACLPPDTVIIRAPSSQPQISYIKLTFNSLNTDKIRLAVDVAHIMTDAIGPTRKGIIFCSTIEEAEKLGSKVASNCVSHSKLPGNVKADNEARWKGGHFQWIAATTGMICGIDDQNVGAIIFVGLGYGLVNLYQGAGRSGRDGTPSWTVVLKSSNTHMAIPKEGLKDDPQCIEESDAWLYAKECRRIGFSLLFDRARISCFDLPNAHFCDFCKPDSELVAKLHSKIIDPPDDYDILDPELMNMDFEGISELADPALMALSCPSSTASFYPSSPPPTSLDLFRFAPTPTTSMQTERRVAYYQATLITKEAKSKMLNAFTKMLFGKCPLCWAYQGILVPRHKDGQWIQCRGPLDRGYMETMGMDRPFKKKIRYPPYLFCWKCHLPQDSFMPPTHPSFVKGQGSKDCPHEDFVVFLVMFIRQNKEWWKRACKAFGMDLNISEDALVKWYTAEDVQGGFNNSIELILWFYMEREKERKEE
jgi:Helicase conserved C-terminal domain